MENYHSDNNRRPAGNAAGEALGDAAAQVAWYGIITSGVKSYQNHKARTGNTGEAAYQSALTMPLGRGSRYL